MPSPYADRLRRLPVQRREVEVHGGTTAYWAYGPDDADTTVVAVHGFRGEHHGLEPVLAFLPEVRVIAPDLPGFGESALCHDARMISTSMRSGSPTSSPKSPQVP